MNTLRNTGLMIGVCALLNHTPSFAETKSDIHFTGGKIVFQDESALGNGEFLAVQVMGPLSPEECERRQSTLDDAWTLAHQVKNCVEANLYVGGGELKEPVLLKNTIAYDPNEYMERAEKIFNDINLALKERKFFTMASLETYARGKWIRDEHWWLDIPLDNHLIVDKLFWVPLANIMGYPAAMIDIMTFPIGLSKIFFSQSARAALKERLWGNIQTLVDENQKDVTIPANHLEYRLTATMMQTLFGNYRPSVLDNEDYAAVLNNYYNFHRSPEERKKLMCKFWRRHAKKNVLPDYEKKFCN